MRGGKKEGFRRHFSEFSDETNDSEIHLIQSVKDCISTHFDAPRNLSIDSESLRRQFSNYDN